MVPVFVWPQTFAPEGQLCPWLETQDVTQLPPEHTWFVPHDWPFVLLLHAPYSVEEEEEQVPGLEPQKEYVVVISPLSSQVLE
ncbi:MAG: hypothetical protein A2842_02490 [Candidatus Wildermuthbacteria bacterium RIFCSPHIGHO2_01_FULL_48_25]|uniref:Uncharacterized protein n=1 Tax=Candidatus Wildermuthbacteria bacterium RIFCSPLOWO2_01_FULL_48_16 TaxID=1802461 RepID=A0A1G2RLJ9_9BACT|nr:MAG: hypothetical protein A2842_02490 [Candidatus Wildermuthbacteria bacterium RIFCSPHIGHO2_01_FULL_48_25]OHA72901.1 MAG: hypothetical protein A3B24_03340 [Candidatus Wildermuthbacteria bacterium RIFCSPLOWO2_01_FULL_48_16]